MNTSTAPVKDSHDIACTNCGAELVYKPGTTTLVCDYCRSSFEIPPLEDATAEDAARENDLNIALANWSSSQPQQEAYVVSCASCGAQTALQENLFSDKCTFCGSPITVKPDERSLARPQGVLPFKLEKSAATGEFKKWIKSLWFAPNDLSKTALQDNFNGVYLPYWTFDAATATRYTGQRGDDYYEKKKIRENGKTREVQVRKTRWTFVSGSVQRAFDDILVTASKSLPGNYLNILEPWDLKSLVPYDNLYFSGYQAEVCQIDIREGFEMAKEVMENVIRGDIVNQIGGDHQNITGMQTAYDETKFKYILLPVWLSVYRYRGKLYRFVVNARTGEVHGERPWSVIKIVLAVIAVLIVIAFLVSVFGQS